MVCLLNCFPRKFSFLCPWSLTDHFFPKNCYQICWLTKGQLISKANCQAVDSPKKGTNEFAFFWLDELLPSKVKRRSFIFLENLIFHKKWSHAFEINWPLESSCMKRVESYVLWENGWHSNYRAITVQPSGRQITRPAKAVLRVLPFVAALKWYLFFLHDYSIIAQPRL